MMAFVPGYDSDVFVSYAHIDNEGERAWVTTLVRSLDTEVRQRLGSKDLRIWMDSALDGNRPITPEVMQAIRRSATLLVVMSPSYLRSEWCAKERNAFLAFARDCVTAGRIFIVRCRETEQQSIPPEFGDLKGFKFWTRDREFGVTRPLGAGRRKEQAYYTGIDNLSDKLAQVLKDLRAAQQQGQAPAQPLAGKRVFLARSTDDLEEREEELEGYLTQAGLSVLPEIWYPEDDERAFRAAMQADLARCPVFVQLLGRTPGRKARFADGHRFPILQYEIAHAAGTPILQWRDLADDPALTTDLAHRALLERAQACGFEEFKRRVVETARRKPEMLKSRPANVAVFVNADRDDLAMAREVSELLAREGVESYWPIMEGAPEKIRQDLEENLKACDGLVLVYGGTERSWVRDQLRQGRKVLSRRDRPLAALAIYLGPPPQKKELAVALPQLVTLDGRSGITRQTVREFVEKLTTEA
ncbi:MAG: toll/interleukin-1 receptor domain-containing protein [Acetobacteraceae bacterium]|nr:toll/interleukin-1 receptor domain-containing protein [Acetobacteraceae bacterium]